MAILLNNNGYDNRGWRQALAEQLPDMSIHLYPHIPDPEAIEYAVVWNHPPGELSNYPLLKAIFLLGAGTEHIDNDPHLPRVPVVRLIDPAVVNDMALYACYWVVHFHRRFEDYRRQAERCHWQRHDVCATGDFRVAVLGLGQIGASVARRIADNGYQTLGWDAVERDIDKVAAFAGEAGLRRMLARTQVLVNCLPLNAGTRHLLNAETLGRLPEGAFLVNLSRGAVIDDEALLATLEAGRVAGAALDCFAREPLPPESPFWRHDRVFVTPHTAGAIYAHSAAPLVAANIRRVAAGETPFPIYLPPQHRDARAPENRSEL